MQAWSISRSSCALAVLLLLSACGVLEEDKVNYKAATQGPSLDIPPDLNQLRRDSRYAADNNSATASGFAAAQKVVKDTGTASNVMGDVRMERSGAQRWLVVNRPADQVWESLREFWTKGGFTLTTDAADLGIMETEWAENRAKIPQDFIRRTVGKVLDGLYSSGERDRYRTRVERNANGGVDIFISHKGMVEEYADSMKQRTIWKPRPSDPELEIEFLRRLMVKLGAPKEQVEAATALNTPASPSATLDAFEGKPALRLNDPIDRAWRRTGLALDRSGFTVEDRDRNKGLYFVRYVPQADPAQDKGFFGNLFSSKPKDPALTRYQIQLQALAGDSQTLVRVLNTAGQAEKSDNAEKILKLLSAELR